MRICGAAAMKQIDRQAIYEQGIPGTTLMTRAGLIVCDVIAHKLESVSGKRFKVFCAPGKNGGDGFVIARELKRRGGLVETYLAGNREKFAEDTAVMVSRYEQDGGEILPLVEKTDIRAGGCDCMVDALFGIGFRGTLQGGALAACQYMNETDAMTVAVDLPSGVETDTAHTCADAVMADVTVTFTLPKPGCCLTPGAVNCGELIVADIGISSDIIMQAESAMEAVDETFCDARIPVRRRDSHKGDYGKVLIIGGSAMYPGAPFFTTQAAVRTGAGLVTSAVPSEVYPILAVKVNEAMPYRLPSDNGILTESCLETLEMLAQGKSACAIGMGLGRDERTQETVRRFLKNLTIPAVVDADGINALCGHIDMVRGLPLVLTPHDGEMVRLAGETPPKDGIERAKFALACAKRFDCMVLLKGYRTIIADPDGRLAVNTTGNPGMAKGGSGDVLSGIIAALLGFGLSPYDAAACGAYLHGMAGDLCAERLGEYGMTPTDMLAAIPDTLKAYSK